MSYLKTGYFFILGISLFILSSCSITESKGKIDFVYVNWAEGIAMVNVAKVLLEEYGYEVTLKSTDVAPLYSSLSKGKSDVFLEAWLPVQDQYYIEKYGKDIERLGVIYDGAQVGLVVPDYVTINSIEELNANKDKFNEQIVGIDAGAGTMQVTAKMLETYNLDLELMSSSEAGMTSTLKKEIERENWVVVTGWKPHWMFSRWKLKILKDPKNAFGNAEQIIAFSRKGFKEDRPLVAKFVENIFYTDDQMNSLMNTFEEGKNDIESAEKWISKNRSIVDNWIPKGMKEALNVSN